jgi:hydrogenase nickel incorporation protein HypA/HybF
MHELSIALNLVELGDAAARRADAQSVDCVHLRLGVMSGVVKEALCFAYEIASQGTRLQGSWLEIEDVPLVVYCPACGREVALPTIQSLQCPTCGAFTADIRSGTELELVSLEIGDYAEID